MADLDPKDVILLSMTRQGPHPQTAICIEEARNLGFPLMHRWGVSDIVMCRSSMIESALAKEPKAIFWIDGDITFTPNQILQVLIHLSVEDKIGEVCGVYMKRNTPEVSFQHVGALDAILGVGGNLTLINGAPLGFTAILTEALEESRSHAPKVEHRADALSMWCLPMVHNGLYYSEDFALSRRIRLGGWKVCVDLSCEVKHVYEHAFNYHDSVSIAMPQRTSTIYGKTYPLRIHSQAPDHVEKLRTDTDV